MAPAFARATRKHWNMTMRFTLLPAGRTAALAAALGLLFTLPAAAAAQTMAHPAPKAPAPAAASSDDPAKVAAARAFIVAYHPQIDPKNIRARMDKFMPRMIAAAKETNPKDDPKKLAEQRRAAFIDNAEKELDRQSHVVSRHFTMQELKAMTAFFSGSLGRKLNDETPKIRMEMVRERRLRMGLPKGGMAAKMVVGPDSADAKKQAAPKK
jgi:hypothetical protein